MATRLIRALVTSNSSGVYIAQVAQVFNGTSTNARGDMQAVIRATLLHPAARNDTPPNNFGRLRTPMQHTIALARALNINPGLGSKLATSFYDMDEALLDAPSGFGHYSPLFRIPGIPSSPLFGPEFQIYSTSTAANRANFLYSLISRPGQINPALRPFVDIAGNASALVAVIDNTLRSHARQILTMQTGYPSGGVNAGWGGRALDQLQSYNGNTEFPVAIAMDSPAAYCAGAVTRDICLQPAFWRDRRRSRAPGWRCGPSIHCRRSRRSVSS